MAELREEQIKHAMDMCRHREGLNNRWGRETIIDIAPYLQLPWEMATIDEISRFVDDMKSAKFTGDFWVTLNGITTGDRVNSAMVKFLDRRNAALQPKEPSREEKIRYILEYHYHSVNEFALSDIAAFLNKENHEN